MAVTWTPRVVVGQRVEPRVVAERTLDHQLLRRVDVALDDDLRFGRHLQVAGHGRRQPDRRATEEPGEEELVHRRGQRRRRGVHRGRIGPQHDGHRHALAPRRHGPPVRRTHLVPLPVHGQLAPTLYLDAVEADVPCSRRRIPGDHHREREVRAPITRPAHQVRQLSQVQILLPEHHRLAWSRTIAALRRHPGQLSQPREHGELPGDSLRRRGSQQVGDACSNGIQRGRLQGHGHAPVGAEQVDGHRMTAGSPPWEHGALEEQGRPTAGALHAPVGDLGDLAVDRYALPHAHQLARLVQRGDEVAQAVEAHRIPQWMAAMPPVRRR